MSDRNKNEVALVSLSSMIDHRIEKSAAASGPQVSLDHTASLLKASTLLRQFDRACGALRIPNP